MSSDSGTEGEEEGGLRISPMELLAFVGRAIKTNRWLCIIVGVALLSLGSVVAVCVPSNYESTARVYIQEGGNLTGAIAAGYDRGRQEEAARGIDELIMAHDNLVAIVREADIYSRWPLTRPGPLKLKDKLMEALFGAESRARMEHGYLQQLTKAVTASKDGEASVRVRVQWRDPALAYDLTRLILRNFLAARAAHELEPIRRAIPYLEEQQRVLDEQVEASIARITSGEALTAPIAIEEPAAPGEPGDAKKPAAPNSSMAKLVAISRELAQVQRDQRALLAPRRQSVADLKVGLNDLRAQYSDEHPLVLRQLARIEAASADPPELAELKIKEAQLRDALAAPVRAHSGAAHTPSNGAEEPPLFVVPKLGASKATEAEEAERSALQVRLTELFRKIAGVTSRLESTRVELAAAEANFQHRYIVIEPPEVPLKPLKPKKQIAFAVAFIVALLGAIGTAVVRELRRGRITELWQMRDLGLQFLGEVEVARLPSSGSKSRE